MSMNLSKSAGSSANHRHHRKRPRWLVILLSVILAAVVAFFIVVAVYVNDYYHADPAAAQYLAGGSALPADVQVSTFSDNGISGADGLFYDGPGEKRAFIFYPGAKVEYTAYAPLMALLAENGLDCFLVQMPLNLAFTNEEAAGYVMNADKFYDAYEGWYVGGHSLGGAMAGSWAADNLQDHSFKGVIFLAAYPTKSLDAGRDDFCALTIYGSNDGVLNRERLQEGINFMPSRNKWVEIAGGNHAQFADYGPQKGDGTATITRQEQQTRTVEEIISFLESASEP